MPLVRTLVAAVALAAAAGCAHAPSPPAAAPPETSSSTEAAAPRRADGAYATIADYLAEAGVIETQVARDDPAAPRIDMPPPPGWVAAGDRTPPWAFSAFLSGDPAVAADPPSITTLLYRLTGPVDTDTLLTYASGELSNLPGFDNPGIAQAATLSGFPASQTGGSYVKDGVQRLVAQKTVLIPARDGDDVFVLQINANGPAGQWTPLLDATRDLDTTTVITP